MVAICYQKYHEFRALIHVIGLMMMMPAIFVLGGGRGQTNDKSEEFRSLLDLRCTQLHSYSSHETPQVGRDATQPELSILLGQGMYLNCHNIWCSKLANCCCASC